jgi:large subunit ribosomal protein L25
MTTTLKAHARKEGENLTNLRKEGLVPAVVYGAGRTTTSIAVAQKDLIKVWKAAGESGTVMLDIDGSKVTVLIHELVNDPIKDVPQHVDFLAIDINKPIEVALPLEFVGISGAVKAGLGSLVKNMHEIQVKGLSKDIPHMIEVDLSSLDALDTHITVGSLKLPKGLEAISPADAIIANVASIKEEKEAVAVIDFTQIEVEKRGKKEEDAADAA